MGSTLRHDVKTSKQNIVEVDIKFTHTNADTPKCVLVYGEDVTVSDPSTGIISLTWGSPMGKLLSASGSVMVSTVADSCVQFVDYVNSTKILRLRLISNNVLNPPTDCAVFVHCVFDQND